MFDLLHTKPARRPSLSRIVSFGLHGLLLAAMIRPNVAYYLVEGSRFPVRIQQSGKVIVTSAASPSAAATPRAALPYRAPTAKPVRSSAKPRAQQPHAAEEANATTNGAYGEVAIKPQPGLVATNPELGDPRVGQMLRPSIAMFLNPSVHDIHIALPQKTPDPDIHVSEFPKNFEGDIVIEITINRDGRVAKARVEQSINPILDKKVLAALFKWEFKPASFDGTPVASLQEIHFHYPLNALP